MKIPNDVHVLGFTKNADAMKRTCKDVARAGFEPKPFWNFPTPYTQFIQKHLASANNAMRNVPSFFNSGWGHYSILCIARDLGKVPVFIVEDDCRFLKDTDLLHKMLADSPDDADLLLLDSFGPKKEQDAFMAERSHAVNGWAKITAARSAAAYIVGPRYIDRLINLGDRGTRGKKVRIFDQWFETRWLEGANIYCAVPNLAIQSIDMEFHDRPSARSNLQKYIDMGVVLEDYAEW